MRELLSLLALRRSLTRDQLCELLWPELDPVAGTRNLRVTLAYARRVLEPERTGNHACFHLRSEGERVWLHRSPELVVDLWEAETQFQVAARPAAPATPIRRDSI